jgi:hypothetical protein
MLPALGGIPDRPLLVVMRGGVRFVSTRDGRQRLTGTLDTAGERNTPVADLVERSPDSG